MDGATTRLAQRNVRDLARCITAAENNAEAFGAAFADVKANLPVVPVLGITGTGGAGKSSMVDELVRRFLIDFPEKRIALVSVDPSKRKTGGALLGDRIRMNAIHSDRVYMRSLATRQSNLALSRHVQEALDILKAAEFDLIVLETSGIGQSDTEIMDHSDVSLYVMTPEFGAATQLEKIDMLDFADVVAINKFDKRGAQDALRDVRKQFKRNHDLWEAHDDDLPVVGTIASQFNDPGTNELYRRMMNTLADKTGAALSSNFAADQGTSEKVFIIPPARTRYLSEIAESNRAYDRWAEKQADLAGKLQALSTAADLVDGDAADALADRSKHIQLDLDARLKEWLEGWPELRGRYEADEYVFQGAGQGHQDSHLEQEPLPPRHPQGCPPLSDGMARPGQVAPAGKPARLLPLHRGHLPLQAGGRGSHAHVRWRRRARAHQQAFPLRLLGHACQAVVDGL